ncbi:hypothetical protein H6775_02815 [Candidatus Nomurabacteria bacterium]|nr:hypothetical protein [Candidatus Nomurabacteria bacterium]
MLYFTHGTDTQKSIEKTQTLIDSLLAKKPNASLFKLTTENWDLASFQEFLAGQALFENKYIVYISRILEDSEISNIVLDSVKDLQESENIFIWLEGKVDAKSLKQIEKYAEKVQYFEEKEVRTVKSEFNIFSLGEALGNRDKKKLWLLFNEAKEYFVIEEIHGTLFWQVKSMLLALRAKSADEAGMKSFPFSKAKGFNKNYSEKEVYNLSAKLIDIHNQARRGIHDFDIALERFCLEI